MPDMTRRTFLASSAALAAAGRAGGMAGPAQDDGGANLPRPSPAQLTWQDCEIGLLYSFDLAIAAGIFAGNNTVRKTLDPNLYNPVRLDTDQWLEAAKAAGAKYAVFTATHFNGFMQWQSDLYPYGLKQTKWRGGKGDVVGDFVASCRKAGVLPGIYFSTHRNAWWTVWGHYVDWGKGKDTPKQQEFNRVAEKMTEELCSRYGPLVQIWYDAGVKTPDEGGPDVLPIFQKHQPDSVFYHSRQRSDHRWIGNEAGHAGYPCWATMPGEKDGVSHNSPSWKRCLHGGDPAGSVWSPGMVDVPLRGRKAHNWFWAPNQDAAAEPVDSLMKMHCESVGRNCNLVIGEVVAPDGRVPDSDIQRLGEFGREVARRFGSPAGQTRGEGEMVELALKAPGKIARAVIMEDIARGERIRRYVLEGRAGQGEWRTLREGSCVGHKRIEEFEPAELSALRLRVLEAQAPPKIRLLAAHGEA